MFSHFKLLSQIFSDDSTSFKSDDLTEFVRQNGVRYVHLAPHKTLSNGKAECVVGTFRCDAVRQRRNTLGASTASAEISTCVPNDSSRDQESYTCGDATGVMTDDAFRHTATSPTRRRGPRKRQSYWNQMRGLQSLKCCRRQSFCLFLI